MAENNGDTNTAEKREECRDFRRNVCTKGDNCKYYHPPRSANAIFERNSVCHDFQNPKGCHRETCKFLHLTKDQEEFIRANGTCPPSLSQQEMDKIAGLPPLCNDFMRGTCRRGMSCKFRHMGEPEPVRVPRPDRPGGDRFEPYRRPGDMDSYDRLEMKRRYREEMMEDEIMYLRAQVSRLKRQIADLGATNESLMDENARLRIDRTRAVTQDSPALLQAPPARLSASVSQPRMASAVDYSLTQTRSAYPYTSGLKVEPSVPANPVNSFTGNIY